MTKRSHGSMGSHTVNVCFIPKKQQIAQINDMKVAKV